ncbi:MAG: hypothetical protein QXR45_16745 [Candidatus Bathyarchaeia archaeon]
MKLLIIKMALHRKKGRPKGPSFETRLKFQALKLSLLQSNAKWPSVKYYCKELGIPRSTFHRHKYALLWGDSAFVAKFLSRFAFLEPVEKTVSPEKRAEMFKQRLERLKRLLRAFSSRE